MGGDRPADLEHLTLEQVDDELGVFVHVVHKQPVLIELNHFLVVSVVELGVVLEGQIQLFVLQEGLYFAFVVQAHFNQFVFV